MPRPCPALASLFVFSTAFAVAAPGCGHRPSSLETASEKLGDQPPATAAAPGRESEPAPPPRSQPASSTQPPPTQAAASTPASPAPPVQSPSPAASGDSPYISRSAGQAHGMIVLWPRVIPRGTEADGRDLAGRVQQHVVELVQRAVPGKHIDRRPEPEQTCRRAGCDATALGVLFSKQGGGCLVVAVVTPPGPVETTLVPWAGKVDLKRSRVPFRTPPEGEVKVLDYARCDRLLEEMRGNDAAVEAAVRRATP